MRCSGELKRLRPSSVGEVNAYLSCVQFSGDVKRKGNQNNRLVEKLGTPLRYMKYKYPSKFEISYFKKLKQIIE